MGRKFTFELDIDNAAFEGDNLAYEVARVLREAAGRIEGGATESNLRDANGNTVGKFKLAV